MSNPRLPVEMLDHIVDQLHDTTDALRNCCLVSKSWIPRTRKHLFANIELLTAECLQSWKETFPDLSTSPARYAKTLSVGCPEIVTSAEAGAWIRGFSRVLHLKMVGNGPFVHSATASFVPFHGFSPIMKSLSVFCSALPFPQISNLILSFPLLEDLALYGSYCPRNRSGDVFDGLPTATQSPGTPVFTGSLELFLRGGMKPITHWLLSLPGGIHFRKLTWAWFLEEELSLTGALVEACSHTLESLTIVPYLSEPKPVLIDLSKATKLKDVTFHCVGHNVEWVIVALQTVTSNQHDFQKISLHLCPLRSPHIPGGNAARARDVVGESNYKQWLELVHLLVQLWESHSIRLTVSHWASPGKGGQVEEVMSIRAHSLFPEVTSRGIAVFVGRA